MPGSATTPSPAPSRTLTADSPATVIIARHGLRIDFVDPDWRLTAERPHDSPMTQSGRVMGWRMGVHLWARLRALHPSRTSTSSSDGANDTTGDVERRVAEVAALLDRVVVLASPLMRAVDTAAHVCQGLEDAAAEELAAYADPRTSTTDGAWDHRSRLPATLSHPEGHPMVIGGAAPAEGALSRRIPIHVEPAMTETTYWMCRDMCKKYRRSYLEAAEEVPHPIVLPAEVLKRSVSDRVIAPLATQEDPSAGVQRAVLCPVHYQFDPKRGTVVEALQPVERFSRAWVHLLAPQRYAADATSGVSSWTPTQAAPGRPAPQSMSATGHAARTPFVPRDDGTPAHTAKPDEPSPYRNKIVLLLGHGQTVAGMAQTLPHVLHGHFAVPAAHVPRVTPTEAPLAGFAMFHRRPVVETDQDAHTYDTIVDAFSEEHLGSAE